MLNSKLINILQSLSNDEKRHLRKWFSANFVNKNDAVYKLFYFIDTRRSITELTIKKIRAFEYLFKDELYNDQTMRHLMWQCIEIIEDFLVYYTFVNQRNNKHLLLMSVYQQKNLPLYANESLTKIKKNNEQLQLQDSDYYLEQLQIEKNLYNIATNNTRYASLNIQHLIDKIDEYAVAETLRWSCIALSHQRISGNTYHLQNTSNYIQQIENGLYANNAAVQIYFLLYKLSKEADDIVFEKLFNALFIYEKNFTETELKDIFLLSINYCISELNVGKQIYAQYAFDLFMHALSKKYLLENNELDRFTFKNIAFIAIKRLKDFKKAEHFIDAYRQYLPEAYREHAVLFTKATLYFEQKDYKKAMRILQQVEFADVLWNLNAKNMLLKMYFEEAEYEALLTFLNSYKVYLKRQKQIGYHQTRYLKVITLCKKLYNNIGASKNNKTKLKQIIIDDNELPEKEWFLEQVNKL